jgi:hypothetical protein
MLAKSSVMEPDPYPYPDWIQTQSGARIRFWDKRAKKYFTVPNFKKRGPRD